MNVGAVSTKDMLSEGLKVFGSVSSNVKKHDKQFLTMYGSSVLTCTTIYRDLDEYVKIENGNVRYFLMTLWWLHRYQTEASIQVIFGIESPIKVRTWIWKYTYAIQSLILYKIDWQFLPSYPEPVFLLSIDGTHCPIEEQRKVPDRLWYSHKINGPAVSYGVAVSLVESKIEWVSEMHKAGNNDLAVYRADLKDRIPPGMLLVGDKGYEGEDAISITNDLDTTEVKKFKRRCKARQEKVNSLIKQFEILNTDFRHPVEKHKTVFDAVCVILQYKLEIESPLYEI